MNLQSDMAAFFDRLAPDWDNAPSERGAREKLVAMMGLPQRGVFADIGCGKGVMVDHLLELDPLRIVAVDISGEMIRLAKALYDDPSVTFINGDFYETALPVLDAAIFFNAYPHFINKLKLAEMLAGIVKKGGFVIIAHSFGKDKINGMHKGNAVSKFSVPLQSAETEAAAFGDFFTTGSFTDDSELFFLKLIRK